MPCTTQNTQERTPDNLSKAVDQICTKLRYGKENVSNLPACLPTQMKETEAVMAQPAFENKGSTFENEEAEVEGVDWTNKSKMMVLMMKRSSVTAEIEWPEVRRKKNTRESGTIAPIGLKIRASQRGPNTQGNRILIRTQKIDDTKERIGRSRTKGHKTQQRSTNQRTKHEKTSKSW